MNKFILSVLLLMVASPVSATPVNRPEFTKEEFDNHNQLWHTLEKAGYTVVTNHPNACVDGMLGVYSANDKAIAICQTNAFKMNGEQVQWSAEDLDTLRHEAHHVVQDCMVGGKHDGQLGLVYRNLDEMVAGVVGYKRARRVADLYRKQGASEHVQELEVEAYVVAQMNDPLEQVRDVEKYCM